MTPMNDAALLAAVPEFFSIGSMFKARPAMEGDKRVLYFEASNEGTDQQGEVIAAKALGDSADYFLKYGNIDIDHYTMLGPRLGIPDHQSYEIGRPIDVGQAGGKTFVKAEVFQGEGPAAKQANLFWSTLVDIKPAQRWYPSVAGPVLDRGIDVDAKTGMRKAIIKKVRWVNVGLSKTPVNQHVGACGTLPLGTFAKALTAGYGTDSATLTGGAALRTQSREGTPLNYFDYRNKLADAMRAGDCGENPSAHDLVNHTVKTFGCSESDAAEHVERFMRDIHSARSKGN